ncbi:MAG: zinc-ribbon domain-containing protein [Steroidobacterales bacterium]
MAMLTCSECGRAISDKAPACISCGAPLPGAEPPSAFNREPMHSATPPLTSRQLRWRLALSGLTLVLGVIVADAVGRRPAAGRSVATLAALLVVIGLCWFIVAVLQSVQSRRQ